MPNKNKVKGSVLEKAVRLIQESILKSDPKFAGIEFSIEHNQILTIAGVRHEIDVLVKTLPSSQYESIWIFECKNWSKPVGKNEVIVLAEKVKAAGATRGFLVAREFTSDAKAQVALDNRLSLVYCTDEFSTNFTIELTHVIHEPEPVRLLIKQRGAPPLNRPDNLDWRNISCQLNGNQTDIRQFVLDYVEKAIRTDQKNNQQKNSRVSSHYGSTSFLIEFELSEFSINGKDIQYIRVDLDFWVKVQKLKLISKFELKNQGRVFSFESDDDDNLASKIQIDFVQRI
jgi:hypothetical protein